MGFNLGDELVWNCLAPANLTIVADAVRQRFPRGQAIVWYNEATPPLNSAVRHRGGGLCVLVGFNLACVLSMLMWMTMDPS